MKTLFLIFVLLAATTLQASDKCRVQTFTIRVLTSDGQPVQGVHVEKAELQHTKVRFNRAGSFINGNSMVVFGSYPEVKMKTEHLISDINGQVTITGGEFHLKNRQLRIGPKVPHELSKKHIVVENYDADRVTLKLDCNQYIYIPLAFPNNSEGINPYVIGFPDYYWHRNNNNKNPELLCPESISREWPLKVSKLELDQMSAQACAQTYVTPSSAGVGR
jgi:hypothetical protein